MDLAKLDNACTQVKQIIKHQNEIKELLSEDFNIYRILGKEHSENTTHSNFIGELLNPKGSHNFGDCFLKLFLSETNLSEKIDSSSTTVTIEKYIGSVDKNEKTGGRIDIYLQDQSGRSICIENKIQADDQPDQLLRYSNYNKGKNQVVYLTLWGNDADEKSKGELVVDLDYHLISYRDHILNWVVNCQKEAINKETVRSGLSHYINLIKKLTNQNMEADKKKELHDIIRVNYSEAQLMADHITEVERDESYKIFEEAKKMLNNKLGEVAEIKLSSKNDWKNKYHGMSITFDSSDCKLRLCIEGQSYIWKSYTIIGFPKKGNDENAIKHIAPNGFKNTSFGNDYKSSKGWYAYVTFLQWNQQNERAKLFEPNERKNNLDYIVNTVVELVNEFRGQ